MAIRISTLVLVLAAPLEAGVLFEIETQDHSQSPPIVEEIRMAAQGERLLMEIQGGGERPDGQMIFRADRREMVVIHPALQSYMLLDMPTIRQLGVQVGRHRHKLMPPCKTCPRHSGQWSNR